MQDDFRGILRHMTTAYKWQFAPRFRRNAFGWKSDTPIQRIKEALVEIKAVAKREPELAAEGAVLFLERLAPAIEQVDSSSGRIGSAVNRAIETLVPIIAKANVSRAVPCLAHCQSLPASPGARTRSSRSAGRTA